MFEEIVFTPRLSKKSGMVIAAFQEWNGSAYKTKFAEVMSSVEIKNEQGRKFFAHEHHFHKGNLMTFQGRSEVSNMEYISNSRNHSTFMRRPSSCFCRYQTKPDIIICANQHIVVIGKGGQVEVQVKEGARSIDEQLGFYSYDPVETIVSFPTEDLPKFELDIRPAISFLSYSGQDKLHYQFQYVLEQVGKMFDLEVQKLPVEKKIYVRL